MLAEAADGDVEEAEADVDAAAPEAEKAGEVVVEEDDVVRMPWKP